MADRMPTNLTRLDSRSKRLLDLLREIQGRARTEIVGDALESYALDVVYPEASEEYRRRLWELLADIAILKLREAT